MKKYLIIALLAILGMTQSVAQESEYVPFVREGVQWVCCFFSKPYYLKVYRYYTLELKGDVTINGKEYKAMHKYSGESINWDEDTIPIYLREENRVVYGIVPDGYIYPECPIGVEQNDSLDEQIRSGEEFVLYDFNDPVAFIKSRFYYPQYVVCPVIPDKVSLGDRTVNRYIFRHYTHDYCLVEGVGADGPFAGYPLAFIVQNNEQLHLSKVVENGEVIYNSEAQLTYEGHEALPPRGPIMPIAREGVKWVNERVIINKGDTTRSYYTYEFCGLDSREWALCYSYIGDTLDTSEATLVASFQGGYSQSNYNPVRLNLPMSEVREAGRDMIWGGSGGHSLYQDGYVGSDISTLGMPNFYIFYEKGEYFTRENLVKVEPLVIDGYECWRWAYLDDDGRPLAYVIEGIGFDSYDMGDLLTPFTRKPDPDAEYQEYWGLSHVIKDGKIIYKGMRYKEPEPFFGDYNGDGQVNISDVTTLINILLTGRAGDTINDMNGDGRLTISDVTTLINYLLTR